MEQKQTGSLGYELQLGWNKQVLDPGHFCKQDNGPLEN